MGDSVWVSVKELYFRGEEILCIQQTLSELLARCQILGAEYRALIDQVTTRCSREV